MFSQSKILPKHGKAALFQQALRKGAALAASEELPARSLGKQKSHQLLSKGRFLGALQEVLSSFSSSGSKGNGGVWGGKEEFAL